MQMNSQQNVQQSDNILRQSQLKEPNQIQKESTKNNIKQRPLILTPINQPGKETQSQVRHQPPNTSIAIRAQGEASLFAPHTIGQARLDTFDGHQHSSSLESINIERSQAQLETSQHPARYGTRNLVHLATNEATTDDAFFSNQQDNSTDQVSNVFINKHGLMADYKS